MVGSLAVGNMEATPRKLIVIRTNNPNKKLTWGL